MGTLLFPNLKRLVINCERDIQMSLIDAARFPALRHFACIDVLNEDYPFQDGDLLNVPPLQSLTLTILSGSHWLSIVQGCQDTLISLALDVEGPFEMTSNALLVFPRLISLELDNYPKDSGEWSLDLKTPVLETYAEYTYQSQSDDFMHADIETVTQLRTEREPESCRLPKVKLIQFIHAEGAAQLLNHLSSNPAHCVELETIEVTTGDEAPHHIIDLVATVNRKLERNISLVFTSKLRDLRGMVRTQLASLLQGDCGPHH